MPYSSYEKCFKQLAREFSEEDGDVFGCIRHSEIDCFYHITAYYNSEGEIMDIDIPADYGIVDWNLLDFFRDRWFHFPAPFKKEETATVKPQQYTYDHNELGYEEFFLTLVSQPFLSTYILYSTSESQTLSYRLCAGI